MQVSRRLRELTPGSDGWEVFNRARAMAEAGLPVIELTIGEHDIGTDPSILEAMHRAACAGHTGYAAIPGTDSLRDAVAARVAARTGIDTGRDNVVITSGAQSGLIAAHMATCDPGDTALYIDPFYATYPGTIRAVGAVDHAVEAHPEDGFQPDAARIDAAARATGATSLMINSPHNPTGVVYSRETLTAIAEVCQARGLWLISDEVYDTQVWDGVHISPRTLPGMADRALVVGSMSKSHAMTGSRIGWIVGPKAAIAHLMNLSTHTTYGVPGYIQDAAEYALAQGDALEKAVGAPFRRRRAAVLEILSGSTVVRAAPPDGAMYVMLDIRATGLSGREFAEALLDAEQIGVMPGESFGRAAAGHIRVALTVEDSRLLDAFSRIVAFAERNAADAA
ncbi:MAG: pyridoxal phosphate-dependent aminotransferase [Pseudomonadota bacterium]